MTITAPRSDEDVSIRPAERADLLAVVRIESESFPQPWPYEAFEHFLGEPAFIVAITATDEVVGYAVSDVEKSLGNAIGHLKDIAVHPAYRNQRVGSALLARSIELLSQSAIDAIKLEVRESNDGARRLYRDFGFGDLRRLSNYYDDEEDAIVMVKSIRSTRFDTNR